MLFNTVLISDLLKHYLRISVKHSVKQSHLLYFLLNPLCNDCFLHVQSEKYPTLAAAVAAHKWLQLLLLLLSCEQQLSRFVCFASLASCQSSFSMKGFFL